MARHFLDLAGAATLETESYLLAQRAVADAVEACAMAVLHGGAGLGRSTNRSSATVIRYGRRRVYTRHF